MLIEFLAQKKSKFLIFVAVKFEYLLLLMRIGVYRLFQESIKTATEIASKSPVAVQTAKKSLIYSQDHTVEEGLEHLVSTIIVYSCCSNVQGCFSEVQ